MTADAEVAPHGYFLPRDTLLARGSERKTWLDGLVTCGVTALQPGVAAYGLLLTKQGKIVTDVFLADDGAQLFIGVAPGHGAAVRELLDRYLVMEDAELSAPAQPLGWRMASEVTSAPLPAGAAPAPAASVLAQGGLQLGTLVAQVEVVEASVLGHADGAPLADLLALHGLGSFGVDFGPRDNPHEASLDRIAVSWTKGCYLGQEVVCMQDMRGKVKRRLVALEGGPELGSALPVGPAVEVDVLGPDGSSVGQVTSRHAGSAGGIRLLASIFSAAIESSSALSVLGQPVRVVEGAPALLS